MRLFPAWPEVALASAGFGRPESGLDGWSRFESWRIASIVGLASMESLALLCDWSPPRPQTLARVADAMEAYMRSPAFLDNMRLSLRLLSGSRGLSVARTQARKKGSR